MTEAERDIPLRILMNGRRGHSPGSSKSRSNASH
jgi:hypothetical protein